MTVESLLRPRVILPILGVVLVAALMFTPEVTGGDVERRLTTYSASPGAASGIYEVTKRLGWPVRQKDTPIRGPLDTAAVYAVLAPAMALGTDDVRALLDAVRGGAGLIMVADSGEMLSDSLHLRHDANGGTIQIGAADTVGCGVRPEPPLNRFVSNSMYSIKPFDKQPLADDTVTFIAVEQRGSSRRQSHLDSLSRSVPVPGNQAVGLSGRGLLRALSASHLAPGVLGIPFGRGRVVAVSDPDFLRNDVIRSCGRDIGPRLIGALEWASRGRRPPVVFDEYHQGFGEHPDVIVATRHFLAATPLGHTILQGLLGGLLLIIALGVRAIPPRSMRHIERRSPLEHVDALARAYEQIGATRTAVRRLVRGLRRRHDRGGAGAAGWSGRAGSQPGATAEPDERFLAGVAGTHPGVSASATLILAAERAGVPATDLPVVAEAIDRIDDVFPHADIPSTVHT